MTNFSQASGPVQHGRGVKGQFVYRITQSVPTLEVVERLGLRLPAEFTRAAFSTLVVDAHAACGEEVLETACFEEPHANEEVHNNNLLVRARRHHRWKKVAKRLRGLRVHVNCSTNVRTWAGGLVCGKDASEHKLPEALDQKLEQWAKPHNSCEKQKRNGGRFEGVEGATFGGLLDDTSRRSWSQEI